MTRRLTLTRRYLLLITAVMTIFVAATLVITTRVMKGGMVRLFQQRIDRAATVLQQYESGRAIARNQEMDAVLSSPRFIAAVETGDSSTIAQETPVYQRILGADVFLLTNVSGKIVYLSGASPADAISLARLTPTENHAPMPLRYVQLNGETFEFAIIRVLSAAGLPIGWVYSGKEFSSAMAHELKRLTGLDVMVIQDENVLGHTESPLVRQLAHRQEQLRYIASAEGEGTCAINGEEVLFSTLPASASGAVITFIGSLDEHVAPIRERIMFYLILLALGGGGVAMTVIYFLTDRYIGRQVNHLVRAAERIASGALDFSIVPLSSDELGFLAGEMEKMRARIVANIAALEKAHQDRLKTEKMAALGQMATGIIHDFKNPMSVIRGTVELLQRRSPDNERLRLDCARINDQIDRMVDLAQDILDYSKGRTRLEIRHFNLADYFESIKNFHQAALQSSGIALVLDGPRDLELGIDAGRFRRVIDNILNNAREALKPGQTVTIRWQDGGAGVLIAIEDNGPGIPEAIKDHLFEPFVTSNKEGGTGLGLAIARKIIEDHGGQIKAESEIARGTRFVITIPSALATRLNVQSIIQAEKRVS